MPQFLDTADMGVYALDHLKKSACSYYRIRTPLRGLYDNGFANIFIDRHHASSDIRHAALLNADIVLFFALGGREINASIDTIKMMKPGLSDDKLEMIYPASVVFDMDDNLDWVHPFNEAFVRLGTRAYDGTLLKPGDVLKTTMGDGEEITLWEDKVTSRGGEIFDVARNAQGIRGIHETARRADGVTVPSPALARYYRDVVGCNNVYVYPNSIVPEDYPQRQLAPRNDGSIRILWQGGGSHMPDWFPLRDAVREISTKYPQVKFVIWGTAFKWVHDNIPEEQLELVEWVDYEGYKPWRMLIDADINLCPLVPNKFNECKSAIKWYESVMPYMPEATLASKAAPYGDEIVDGETGLLYETPKEFVEKLGILIEQAELRRKLGENARRWVLDNRHYLQTSKGLHEFYSSLRAAKKVALEV